MKNKNSKYFRYEIFPIYGTCRLTSYQYLHVHVHVVISKYLQSLLGCWNIGTISYH